MNYDELEWRQAIVLGTALRLGLIRTLANEACSAAEAAAALGFDERAVYTVFSALVEIGILEESGERFRLHEEHRAPLLDEDDPNYTGGSVVHRFELIRNWSRLPEVLRSGEPVADRTMPEFESQEAFIRAMRRIAEDSAGVIAEMVVSWLPEGARILDVGGGPGTNAEAFVARGARVTVFDLPEVIKLMQEHLTASGIAVESGNMNETLPAGPFEGIYFGNTSHMYGPEENHRLFERMRRSLAPSGLLVVKELVRGMSDEAALFAVNMLVHTPRGGTYTASEYESWLREAGYEDVRFEPVPGNGTHLILAQNPR
jgi:2-polyprenyl-3-methyl-5-hydroxy-6-metoxy-1,4-benzoquinol methylase